MSIFTTKGKLLLPANKAEIASVVCTIRIGSATISSAIFPKKCSFLGQDKERHITTVSNKDIGKVKSPLDDLNVNQKRW